MMIQKSTPVRALRCALLVGALFGASNCLAANAQGGAAEPTPIVPTKPIVLFNGKNLENFYTHIVDHKYSDPNRVFTVVESVDGAPAIRVSGQDWGGLITKESYANYHLVVEYRWGDLTWGRRMKAALDSGILVHARGPDGNSRPDFNGPWLNSLEYQLIEGATGDIIRVGGFAKDGKPLASPSFTGSARRLRNGQLNYDPHGETIRFAPGVTTGRLCCSYKDPDWQSTLGYRGANDVEKPVGQWNKAEIICQGDSVTFLLNGQVINKITECSFTAGKLLFQSEGAEIFFRRIELHPVR